MCVHHYHPCITRTSTKTTQANITHQIGGLHSHLDPTAKQAALPQPLPCRLWKKDSSPMTRDVQWSVTASPPRSSVSLAVTHALYQF